MLQSSGCARVASFEGFVVDLHMVRALRLEKILILSELLAPSPVSLQQHSRGTQNLADRKFELLK